MSYFVNSIPISRNSEVAKRAVSGIMFQEPDVSSRPDDCVQPSSLSPPTPRILNPYSCLPCRGKKKKCDRASPCLNCQRLGTECLYVPRRQSARQPPSLVIMERLRRLEGTINRMQKHMSPELAQRLASDESPPHNQTWDDADSTSQSGPILPVDDVAGLGTDLGRLALEDGRSRYIIGSSWASLDDEVQDLKSLLQSPPEKAEQWYPDIIPDNCISTHARILGFGSPFQNLSQMHPPTQKIPVYWGLFKQNCDILIKVLHVPTVEPLILRASHQLGHIPRGLEALMMAVYYTVVVSLSPSECLELLGSEKATLAHVFRLGTDQALVQAGLLETDEIITLQALAIYLTGLRIHSSARAMSTLTSLLVRLANNAGIHRDGTHFKLPPFMVEMRRRLWWSICVLDSRASEDTGYDTMIPFGKVDTQLPLNVNDSDLYANMEHLPQPRVGLTEMTFSVVRFESVQVFQNLQHISSDSMGKSARPSAAQYLKDKTDTICGIENRLHELYLKHLDFSNPLAWFTSTICAIVFTKMRLVAYHPYLKRSSSAGFSSDTKDRLFVESTEVIESWVRLNQEESTHRWRWLCETYFQWYALTFLLLELCERTHGGPVDRAWDAVDSALRLGHQIHSFSSSCQGDADTCPLSDSDVHSCGLCRPFGRLLKRARSARANHYEHSTSQNEDGSNESTSASKNHPLSRSTPDADSLEVLNWESIDLDFVTNPSISAMAWPDCNPENYYNWVLGEPPYPVSQLGNDGGLLADCPIYPRTDDIS
ncbi:unnamed protein product [Clonostachys solani]|uniref:Zn(2)-C6 fungal-type domain-containing protein n=1 Tax=Clonostachys solani TaxID=160281 RepID=A0A9N9Z033_9HYPO|nr:unnamed protein product [Clonostachys solani]